MYFKSRTEAGQKLAEKLLGYASQNCSVIALGEGSVVVGAEIARATRSDLCMFLTEQIGLPGEKMNVGAVNQGGGFVYNQSLSSGEVSDYYSEFHNYIEDQKREKFQRMNRLIGEGGALDEETLQDKVLIIVSDGLKDGTILDSVAEFLKRFRVVKLVVAVPVASVQAVDRMHIIGDELQCLSVTENYFDTDHYYDEHDAPDHEGAIEIINNLSRGNV